MKERFLIGNIVSEEVIVKNILDDVALNAREWIEAELIKRWDETHDTRRMVFRPISQEKRIGLPTGQHVLIGANIGDNFVARYFQMKIFFFYINLDHTLR